MISNAKPPKEITLEFTKVVGEGKALGRTRGKVVFCHGVLPGETARVRALKEKRNYIEAELAEVIKPSERRIPPKEDHYLSCSPWQVMDYSLQAELKKKLSEEILYQTTKENIKLQRFYEAGKIYGYRTKIEYSFAAAPGGEARLAFHKRGGRGEKRILHSGCLLIDEKTNSVALKILETINAKRIPHEKLKSLILRSSRTGGGIVAALYAKSPDVNLGEVNLNGLDGFFIAYSNPLSPMIAVDALIYESGKEYITETVSGKKFYCGFDCFFQNNTALFEKALSEIKDSAGGHENLVDLYSGVGVIGIHLSEKAKSVLCVESNSSAVRYARLNRQENGAENVSFAAVEAEKSEKNLFLNAGAVITDPPRPGMHKKVLKALLEALPEKIVYLSCNPITQGRDANFLLEKYSVEKAVGFDFYPNTPHMETLLVFKRK